MFTVSRYRSKFSKAAFVAFAAIYLLFSVGILKSTHYCMGRASSVVLFSANASECACEVVFGELEEDTCCSDENEVMRISDDHKTIGTYTIRIPHLYILDDLYTTQLIALAVPEQEFQSHQRNDRVPPSKVPLFQTHCSLVFYDSKG